MPDLVADVEAEPSEGSLQPADLAEIEAISASGAAFAVDREDRIVHWNRKAEALFGWSSEEMLGRGCFQVLGGRDAFGNKYCARVCPVRWAAAGGAEVKPFAIELVTKGGARCRTSVRVSGVPEGSERPRALVHVLEERPFDELFAGFRAGARAEGAAAPSVPESPLTRREREVLELLAEGYGAQSAAARLGISYATVRNHVQNVFRKLEVHGQVEAVSVALRRGWI
jgi:DNA-binding CsgD family transcriptional regulator